MVKKLVVVFSTGFLVKEMVRTHEVTGSTRVVSVMGHL